jgi:hypothetical protein
LDKVENRGIEKGKVFLGTLMTKLFNAGRTSDAELTA